MKVGFLPLYIKLYDDVSASDRPRMEAIYEKGELEFKTETYVDTVMLSSLVQRMDTEDDSYESFCNYYLVDDSIDEDTYEEYKFDDCTEDCYFNHVKNTVSMNHIWEITKYTVE